MLKPFRIWSGRSDLNRRPPEPHSGGRSASPYGIGSRREADSIALAIQGTVLFLPHAGLLHKHPGTCLVAGCMMRITRDEACRRVLVSVSRVTEDPYGEDKEPRGTRHQTPSQ